MSAYLDFVADQLYQADNRLLKNQHGIRWKSLRADIKQTYREKALRVVSDWCAREGDDE